MREALKAHLESVTGIEVWNSITFGIMPDEEPKGYVFLSSTSVVNNTRSLQFWGVAIAVSALTLDDLSDKCLALTTLIVNAFKNPSSCLPGLGILKLSSDVDIEAPQSYPNQGNVSRTNGFFTAISFVLEVN